MSPADKAQINNIVGVLSTTAQVDMRKRCLEVVKKHKGRVHTEESQELLNSVFSDIELLEVEQ